MLTRRSPMRRTPLRSKVATTAGARAVPTASSLTRTTRVNPKRETERRSSRVRNDDYLDTSRSRVTPHVRCMIKRELGDAVPPCWGVVCPDHQRDMTGGGMRESDVLSYPACLGCHALMEVFKVPGAETNETRKATRDRFIDLHHADLIREGWRIDKAALVAVPPTRL